MDARHGDYVTQTAAGIRDEIREMHMFIPKKAAGQMVMDARQRIENLTNEQLRTEMDRGEVQVVDIRDVRERGAGGGAGEVVPSLQEPDMPFSSRARNFPARSVSRFPDSSARGIVRSARRQ